MRVLDATPDGNEDRNGWVLFSVEYHEGGKVARRDTHRCSQAEFEKFLRSGELPEDGPEAG